MVYKRSITSSDDDDWANYVPGIQVDSDSSVSWPSGCSKKYEWIWDSANRARRLPRTPTPSASSSSRKESDFDIDEAYNYIDHADSLEVAEGRAEIVERMAATAETQRLRIEQLEQALELSQASEQSAQTLTELLAERVASLSVFNIQVSLALVRARGLVKKLTLSLAVVVVGVWVYLVFKKH